MTIQMVYRMFDTLTSYYSVCLSDVILYFYTPPQTDNYIGMQTQCNWILIANYITEKNNL